MSNDDSRYTRIGNFDAPLYPAAPIFDTYRRHLWTIVFLPTAKGDDIAAEDIDALIYLCIRRCLRNPHTG